MSSSMFGDFDGDSFQDLIVGVSREDIGTVLSIGSWHWRAPQDLIQMICGISAAQTGVLFVLDLEALAGAAMRFTWTVRHN